MTMISAGRGPLLTTAEVSRREPERFLTNQEARTVASWWQSSGTVGSRLAELASTGDVDASALMDDIARTMMDVHKGDEQRTSYIDLADLWAWAVMMAHRVSVGARVVDALSED
jgi:hypothetical protein